LRIQNFRDLTKKSPGCLRTRLVGRSYLNLSDCAPNHMPLLWTVMNSKNVKVWKNML